VKRALHLASLWSPVVAYGALVFYLSSLSGVADLSLGPDYLSHTAEYVGLTLLIIRALNEGLFRPIPWGVHFSALGLSVLYAISDEIHQIWIPRRTASLKDVLSDTLGGVLAMGLAELIQRGRFRADATPVAVVLYTRRDCSLCHEARSLLRGLAAEMAFVASAAHQQRPTMQAAAFLALIDRSAGMFCLPQPGWTSCRECIAAAAVEQ